MGGKLLLSEDKILTAKDVYIEAFLGVFQQPIINAGVFTIIVLLLTLLLMRNSGGYYTGLYYTSLPIFIIILVIFLLPNVDDDNYLTPWDEIKVYSTMVTWGGYDEVKEFYVSKSEVSDKKDGVIYYTVDEVLGLRKIIKEGGNINGYGRGIGKISGVHGFSPVDVINLKEDEEKTKVTESSGG